MTESPLRSLVNRRNRLRRVLKVQEVHNKEWEEGLTKKYVWKKYIQNEFNIEYYTYISYLGINARREIKQVEELIAAIKQSKIEAMKVHLEAMKAIQPTLFSLALAVLLLGSCGIRPSELAKECAEQYPCKDSLSVRELTKTDTLELWDTYIELDTIDCPPSKEGVTLIDYDTVYLKGHKVIITRTVQDSTWYRLDQAALTALHQDLDQADVAIAKLITEKAVADAKAKSAKSWNRWLLIGLFGFLALLVLLLVVRRKSRGVGTRSAIRNPKSAIES
jgi:hypothetical protein